MNVGSLFSGIGGLDHGLARAGFTHVFFCESDPWRRSVLAHHWPGVPIFEDVREVDATTWARGLGEERRAVGGDGRASDPDPERDNAEQHGSGVPIYDDVRDVARVGRLQREDGREPERDATGGGAVPLDLLCGGFPCQDLSVAGNRAGLAGARSGLFYEFARIIDALRPRHVLVENVPGLLSSNGGRDFGIVLGTLADLGYGVAWRTLDSRYFGVPQRRRRVFILATVADGDPRAAAERAGEVLAVGTRCPGHPPTRGETREDVAVASISGIGNGGPDDNDGQAGRLMVFAGHGEGEAAVANALKVPSHGASWSGGSSDTFVAAPLTSGGHPNSNMPERRKEDDVNLAVTAFHQTQEPITGDDFSPALGATSIGMGVAYPLARRGRDGGAELEVGEEEIYNALRAGNGGSSRLNQVMIGTGVRRLTPTECERLQALPDGWTDHGPDSRRYSALGDAVTSSVAEWIGRRLIGANE